MPQRIFFALAKLARGISSHLKVGGGMRSSAPPPRASKARGCPPCAALSGNSRATPTTGSASDATPRSASERAAGGGSGGSDIAVNTRPPRPLCKPLITAITITLKGRCGNSRKPNCAIWVCNDPCARLAVSGHLPTKCLRCNLASSLLAPKSAQGPLPQRQ